MGAFNTTNHKVISVEFNCTTKATFTANGKVAIDSHGLLKDLITATDTGTGTSLDLQSKHVGFIFDVIVLDKDGKQLKDVTVKGFLRKQHYGKDNSLTKWIYIDSFDSKRWKSNLDTKMIVDIYEKN